MVKAVLCNERGDSFLTLITTLNMLLLAFFIVLNSIAVFDDTKKLNALNSLIGTMGLLSSGISPVLGPPSKTYPKFIEMAKLDEGLLELLRRVEQFSMDQKMGKDVSIQYGKKGMRVRLTNRIMFDEGKAELKPAAKKMLDHVGELFVRMRGSINIIGHTSPGGHIKGPYPDDWLLSFARAGMAVRYLVSSPGIQPDRFSVSGYGSTRPRIADASDAERFLNDRIELILNRTKA